MFKQESSVRRVLPAVADTLYGLEMVKSPVFMSLRDAWFLSWWKFPKIGVAAIAAMIGKLRNCWFTFPTGVKLHFLQCYELRGVWWFGVWRCEGRSGERKVRDPRENGENNLVYAVYNESIVTAVGFEADDFCQIILMMNLLTTCLIWFVIAWGILFLFRNEKYSQINHDQFRQIHWNTVTDAQEYFLQSVLWENVIARVIGSFWIIF